MAENSKIEWTDDTLNPIRARDRATGKVGWHCTPASDGCRNCYAEGMNRRLGTGLPYKAQALPQVEVFLDEAMLMKPLRWRKPRKVFLGSMTDIFADFVTDEMLDRIFAMMALTPQHTYQVLTKRAERMRAYACDANTPNRIARALLDMFIAGQIPDGKRTITDDTWPLDDDAPDDDPRLLRWPLPNVWLGVSAEDQKTADERIPHLLATPAAVRFVSAEPLLGPVDLTQIDAGVHDDFGDCGGHPDPHYPIESVGWGRTDALRGEYWGTTRTPDGVVHHANEELGFREPRLDWIIVGGESGPGARPMHPDWARSIRDQCAAAGVAFFFKQWGEWREVDGPKTHKSHRERGAGTHFLTRDGKLHLRANSYLSVYHEYIVARLGKARAGRLLDGIEHNDMPAGAR